MAAVVLARAVRPSWAMLGPVRISRWIRWLAGADPLVLEAERLGRALDGITWASAASRTSAVWTGVRTMVAGGLDTLADDHG